MNEVGRLIADRYRLTQHLGSGAMGTVWQAHDERLHRTVALKQLLLQPGLSSQDAAEARERAMREGRIAARLQHPNAVTVYDVVEDQGQPVLIMEYVPSRSLSQVLEQTPTLPPHEVARIGQQVATALVAAHAAGIVHRDIKPGNVLLAEDGAVKITDFGISRATGDVTVTATGMLAGTPAYLAPEVAKGDPPGPPSDVFSLGSTLYAAVEGHTPFGNIDNTLALLHAVAAGRTIAPRQAGPLTGPLTQMLATDPTARPSMTDVARTLGAVAMGLVPTVTAGSNTGPTALVSPPGVRPAGSETTIRQRQSSGPRPMPVQPAVGHVLPSRPAAAATPGWTVRKALLTALAIALAALVGILVANTFTTTGHNNAAANNTANTSDMAAPPPTSTMDYAPVDTGGETTGTTTNATTTTANNQIVTFPNMRNTLVEFFTLLPAQQQQAWKLLTPAEQGRIGGFNKFQQSWSQVSAVQVAIVLPHSANSLVARVNVLDNSGQVSASNGIFTFEQHGDQHASQQLLISNIQSVGGNNTSRRNG